MKSLETTQILIEELYTASEKYYQKFEDSPMTDEEFDAKLEFLRTVEEDGLHPELFAVGSKGFLLLEGDPSLGTKPASSDTIQHATPMLSLAKAKTEDEVIAFLDKTRAAGAKLFKLQAKLDGFALSVKYIDNKLTQFATRGDGVEGENISYLLNHDEITIIGIPEETSFDGELEIRGELFLDDEQFKKVDEARQKAFGGEQFKNPRNALVGIIKKAKKGNGYETEATFAAYSAYHNGVNINLSEISGFKTADQVTVEAAPNVTVENLETNTEVLEAIKNFGKARENFSIPTDGVVVKTDDEAELLRVMGSSSHHPRSQIAFKYPSPTAITELLAIDLTVGKTGRVTPIGRIRTVQLDGSDISNLSLHNFNYLYTENIRVGQTVMVHKANDIIPQIKAVISTPEDSELMPVPTNCPACDSELSAAKEDENVSPPRTLLCKNLECPSRAFSALKTSVGKNYLDIDGMSEKLLAFLYETGRVTTIADLYTLTLEELTDASFGTTKDGTPVKLGEKRATHILSYIEKSKTKSMPKIVASLSITGLGRSMTKNLMKKFKNIDELLSATFEEIAALEQIGDIRAETIVTGLKHRAPLIARLREHGVEFSTPEASENFGKLVGKSFAISGTVPSPFSNRSAWVEYIEQEGGEFHSSPKASTTFMVGDPEDGSSKIKKAVKLGIDFLSPEEFTTQYT